MQTPPNVPCRTARTVQDHAEAPQSKGRGTSCLLLHVSGARLQPREQSPWPDVLCCAVNEPLFSRCPLLCSQRGTGTKPGRAGAAGLLEGTAGAVRAGAGCQNPRTRTGVLPLLSPSTSPSVSHRLSAACFSCSPRISLACHLPGCFWQRPVWSAGIRGAPSALSHGLHPLLDLEFFGLCEELCFH